MSEAVPSTNGMRSAHPAMYPRAPFPSTSTSPPNSSFRPDAFGPPAAMSSKLSNHATSPTAERHYSERNGMVSPLALTSPESLAVGQPPRAGSSIMIRRLSRNISSETLSSMLIFAGDLVDTKIIQSPYAEDEGFATAMARFQSQAGALEAQQKLHGKPNSTKRANMIVEVHGGGMAGSFDRRNTIDGSASRTQSSSASSAGSLPGPPGGPRFGGAYQSPDQASPPLPTSSSGGSGEFPVPETSTHFQNLFSPQSPLANGVDDRHRVSGKYMINNDTTDDETGELLKDPVAYAKSGQQQPSARRQTNPQLPVARFGNLSLSTAGANGGPNSMHSPPPNGVKFPRAGQAMQSPTSPTHGQMSHPRPQFPPVNPADQNPPCNTLYVGNLPLDTSEDELKAIFSKQRGYKRLCFRTKQNGPMCFVEFEDVSFATKALHELYGYGLSNSVKGGIRLSFSKNPLGVRSGQQANGMGPHPAMNPHAMAPGYGMASPGGFSSVSGPPPGLAAPPGLINGGAVGPQQQYHRPAPSALHNLGMDGMFANPFGMPPQDFVNPMSAGRNLTNGMAGPPPLSGAMSGGGSGQYQRDHRPAYTDYMLGR